MKKKFDPVDWARSTKPKTGGLMCSLCVAAPAVREVFETIVGMRQRGETRVSQAQVAKMLCDKYGIKVAASTVQKHVSSHLGMKW